MNHDDKFRNFTSMTSEHFHQFIGIHIRLKIYVVYKSTHKPLHEDHNEILQNQRKTGTPLTDFLCFA